jgi:sulfatase modifying factor 1
MQLLNRIATSMLVLMALVASAIGSRDCHAAEPTRRLDLGNGIALDLILVKAGSFEQGSPDDEVGRNSDESPRRTVTISRDYYLAKFPITRGQFAQFVAASGYRTESEKGTSGGFGFDGEKLVQNRRFTWRNPGFEQTDEHPVTIVTFDDALAMVRWLSRTTGYEFSLPTEAQWEYACRAGTATPYYSGLTAEDAAAIAWHKANAGNGTRPVGQLQANAWGFQDMLGNVFEWCQDWYGPYPAGDATDPLQQNSNLSDKPRRVLRGGSWLREAKIARSAARYRNDKGSRNADNGFRVAAVATDSPAVQAPPRTPRNTPERQPNNTEPEPAPRDDVNVPPRFDDRADSDDIFDSHADFERGPQSDPPSRSNWGLWAALGVLLVGGVGMLFAWLIYKSRAMDSSDEFAAIANRGTELREFNPDFAQDESRATSRFDPDRFSAAGDLPRATPLEPQARVVVDGFWIDDLNSAGLVVSYRYTADQQIHEGRFTTEPGQTSRFIYTGATPSRISITVEGSPASGTVVGGERLPDQGGSTTVSDVGPIILFDDNDPDAPRQTTRPFQPSRDAPDRPSFTGFPSAY